MPISRKRLAEIVAIADEDINTSEISEADEAWFKGAKLVLPEKDESTALPVEDRERARSAVATVDSRSQVN